MTPAKNLPEPVQWLLDFANIGCISGEPNPQRFKSYYTHTFREYTTNEHIPKLNRPPIELLPPAKEKDTFHKLPTDEQRKKFKEEIENMKPGETITHLMPLHALIKIWKEKGFTNHILHDGYKISISNTGEPVYHGKNIELFPLIVDFCSKRGILLEKNCNHVLSHKKCNYSMAMDCWHIAQSFFNRVIQENNTEDVHLFCEMAFDYAKKNKPNHELSEQVNGSAWDFWNNHRALHSRLRQCLCCGAFWIREKLKTQGRKRVYCSDTCKKRFHYDSRENQTKKKKENTKHKKENERVGIINWICSKGHTKHEAVKIYVDEKTRSQKTVASLKEFQRTYGNKYGIES